MNLYLNSLLRYTVLAVMVIFIAACSQMEKKQVYPWQAKLIWPEPPAKPRFEYVGHFSNPEEFGISRGFFAQVVDFFTGAENQRLIRPMAVVTLNSQEVFVADPGARGVHYFNAKQNDYRLIQRAGRQPLPSPVGLTVGPRGQVLVTDSELGKVFQITAESDIARPFYLQYSLNQPTGITYDKKRKRLYIVDTETHSIHLFDQYGKHIKKVGQRGNGKLQFNFPTMISLSNSGNLLVTDSLNFRVQRLDYRGRFLGRFGKIGDSSGNMTRPKGVASDNMGHIYIVDSLFHAVQVFDKKGRLLMHLGRQGQKPGEFWLPTGIFISDNNIIYIADSYNQRIQVFRYIGGRA